MATKRKVRMQKSSAHTAIATDASAGNSDYALTLLEEAVFHLATFPGPITERLKPILVRIVVLMEDDFSAELLPHWKWVWEMATQCGPVTRGEDVLKGSIDNTMDTIRRSTASKIARRLVYIRNGMRADGGDGLWGGHLSRQDETAKPRFDGKGLELPRFRG